MTERYLPPKSYWKEVRAHESRLRETAQVRNMGGAMFASRAAWESDAADYSAVMWHNSRLLGCVSVTSMVRLAHEVRSDGVAGTAHFTDYQYTSSRLVLPEDRHINRYDQFLYVQDINDPGERSAQLQALDRSQRERFALGLTSADKADYELVLHELERGSSGEFEAANRNLRDLFE